jgi:phosphatidylinositol glycan class S
MAAPNVADPSLAAESEQTCSQIAPKIAATTESPKLPPPETKESLWLRRLSILSFWAVVVFLGLPIWLKTTAIYRAELPLQAMTDWAEGKVRLQSLLPVLS